MKQSLVLAAALLFSAWLTPSLTFAQCTSPACTRIVNNGPDGAKKVLVVMGDGYASADQSKFNQDVEDLVTKGVFGHDFFQEEQNAFNVYRLNLVSVDSGVSQKVYNENGTPNDGSDDTVTSTTTRNTALGYIWSGSWAHCWLEGSANTGTLVQNALNASVPNYDYVVVILNQDSYGGCGGGGFQVVPRGVTWPTLAHEYGHGIGGLADEYSVGGAWTGGDMDGPNCSTKLDRANVFWNRFIDPATAVPTSSPADPNRTVGEFEGCATKSTGIYRPVSNCRMRGNSPPYCPVCYTLMKRALHPFLDHDFDNAVSGDFTGDGRSDVLIHNDNDLSLYGTNPDGRSLDLVWIANNIVPAAPGGTTWQPAPHDHYYVGDLDGDGKDDAVVFNGTDWIMPYLGLLRSTGTGLACVARYDGSFAGFWTMRPHDTVYLADFSGDHRADILIFNGSEWAIPYLGLLRSNGTSVSGVARYDGSIPGWTMKPHDQLFAGDFDGDGKSDIYIFNGDNWSYRYLGLLKSSGSGLSDLKLYTGSLPGWTMTARDRFIPGDFDGDGRSDLYVFNGTDWAYAYLLMDRSSGQSLSFARRYDSSSSAANVPGWYVTKGDRFWLSDANRDGKSDLFVYNTTNWYREYLGTLMSSGGSLSGSWSYDWVGGWNLGPVDQILASTYEGGSGRPDLFIRNHQWFGLLRRGPGSFGMDRIYYHWIKTPLFDSRPWSDVLP